MILYVNELKNYFLLKIVNPTRIGRADKDRYGDRTLLTVYEHAGLPGNVNL